MLSLISLTPPITSTPAHLAKPKSETLSYALSMHSILWRTAALTLSPVATSTNSSHFAKKKFLLVSHLRLSQRKDDTAKE